MTHAVAIAEHAIELNDIIRNFKSRTGSEQINIVAHSKGGLDAGYISLIIY